MAAAVLATALIPAAPASAIANGDDVIAGKYAFSTKITDIGIPTADGGLRDSSCSAALISPHWLLTAGHCFRDIKDRHVSRTVARRTIATIGRTDLTDKGGRQANVIAVKQAKGVDVALAELDRPITGITPLKIRRTAPVKGTVVRLTGYGLTSGRSTKLPQHLKTGRFRITSVGPTELGVTGTAPHKNTSPCKHDSGGPYFVEAADGTATAVGVVSHGPTCPHTGPDTAARVDQLAGWIQSVIGQDVVPPPTPSATASSPAPSLVVARSPARRFPAYVWPVAAGALALAGVGLILALRRRRRP